jgi:hypothetical protein
MCLDALFEVKARMVGPETHLRDLCTSDRGGVITSNRTGGSRIECHP